MSSDSEYFTYSESESSFCLNYSEGEETGWSTSSSKTSQIVNEWWRSLPDACPCGNSQCSWSSGSDNDTQVSFSDTESELTWVSELSIHGDADSDESDLERFPF